MTYPWRKPLVVSSWKPIIIFFKDHGWWIHWMFLCIIESFRSHIVIQGSWVHVMAWAPSWPKLFHLSQPLRLQAQGNILCRTSCITNYAFSFKINEVLLTLHIFSIKWYNKWINLRNPKLRYLKNHLSWLIGYG